MRSWKIVLATFTLCIVSTEESNAGMITDRSALSNLLGGSGIIEDFETGTYGFVWGGHVLDSNTIVSGLGGPGLVVPGVTFIAPSNTVFGAAVGDAPSQEIGGNGGTTYVIDFASPTRAFGLDLRIKGIPTDASLQVFAGDDTTQIGSISITSLTQTPVFAGFQDSQGIGKVEVTRIAVSGGTPMIDNLEFASASAVPEPSSVVLFGVGTLLILVVIRRCEKRVYPA